MDLKPVIPYNSLKDTIALLILFLSLPPYLSTFALSLYILTSSSRTFTSKLFNNLFKNNKIIENNQNSSNVNPSDNHKSFILISFLDIFLCIIIKLSIPNLNKLIFVLANSILTTSLTSKKNNFRNILLSCFSIIFIDYSLKFISKNFIQYSNNNLFPYLSRINNQIHHNHTGLFNYIINFTNLILSIHVILMGFSSIFKNNFISKNINQLSSLNDLPSTNFNSFLFKKETKIFKIINIDVSNNEILKFNNNTNNTVDKESLIGSYPSLSNENEISTDNIVNENFQIFCKSSFSKQKNSIKSFQPLWSLIATIKVMNLKKSIYSGEEQFQNNENNNSLILSNYSKFYDEFKFSNYDNDFLYNNSIKTFIEYIGQTLISFNLKNFNSKLQNFKILVRVNGVIWYQVSKGLFNDYQEILIINGLTPLSQYDIQFILQDNEKDKKYLIDDLIISTVDSNGLDIFSNNNNNDSKKILLSPLNTLQESLITTNDNLNKERIKLKKNRKELSKKISIYKSDIENLKKIVNNSDKNDEKNYNKILSIRSILKSNEIEISKINDELNLIEAKELEINEIFTIEKRKFDLNKRNFQNFENSFENNLDESKNKIIELNNELNLLVNKKNLKLTKYNKNLNDLNKFKNDLSNILNSDLNFKKKLRNERIEKRINLLNEFKNEIKKLETNVFELTKENELLKKELYK